MECSRKNRSSYQTLKDDYEDLKALLIKTKAEKAEYQSALWAIAMMKGPQVIEAPRLALETLGKHETK